MKTLKDALEISLKVCEKLLKEETDEQGIWWYKGSIQAYKDTLHMLNLLDEN